MWQRHPDVFLSYNSKINFLERCEEVVSWFQKFEMDFVTLYFNEPDHTGHDFGPNSPEYMQAVSQFMKRVIFLPASKFFSSKNPYLKIIFVTSFFLKKSKIIGD